MFIILLTLGFSYQPKKIRTRFTSKQPNDETLCDFCHQFVSYIKELVASASLEEEIKEFLDGYCDTLGWPTKDVCKNLVSSYLPTIIQMVEDEIDSLQICQRIGLCNETSTKLKDDPPVCLLCQQLVNVVDYLLSNETIEEEIEELALNFCENYGWPTKDICKQAVKTYLPSFIQYCEENIKPLEICQNVGLCDVTAKASKSLPRSFRKSDQGCQTCQKWFQWAEDKIDQVTVEGLWKLVSEECPKVPYLNYFCQIINEQNIETFVSLILSELPPDQCCQWIKVC